VQPSAHQQAILDHVRDGTGHTMVEAVAGSGKSTALTMVAKTLKSGVAVCFGREAKAELARKFEDANVTGVEASTVHSLGYSALRHEFGRLTVDTSKYFNEAKRLLNAAKVNYKDLAPRDLCRVFDLMRLNMVPMDADVWSLLVLEHGLDVDFDPGRGAELCSQLDTFGRMNKTVVDYCDMLHLPVVLKLRGRKYPWLLVDEAQDISRLQYALIKSALAKGGRMLFVGDRRQAIFAFAGADSQSFTNIIDDLGATLLPLSVCYRCPTSVLERAREYCPQIEARPDAEVGTVRTIGVDQLADEIQPTDFILCRYTAPLVTLCYSLIANGIGATVRGRDIGQGLVTLVKKVCGNDTSMSVESLRQGFGALLMKEERKAAAIANEQDRERVQMQLTDKRDCLTAVLRACGGTTARDVIASISDLFSDAESAVVCSTIHRAKGLESDRVFLFWPCISERARSSSQREQEQHLAYVAVTRARKELVFVSAEGGAKPAQRRKNHIVDDIVGYVMDDMLNM
jgi:DNA helicase-2/ATP-dependent DNA helicase PcrA